MRAYSETKHAVERRRAYRARLRREVLVLFCLLLVYGWIEGLIGGFLRQQLNAWLLPRSFEKGGVTVQRFVHLEDSARLPLFEGIELTVSPTYLRALAKASPFPSVLLPPGLVVDGLTTAGTVRAPIDKGDYPLRFVLQIRDRVGKVPHVRVRFPAAGLNRILDEAFAEDWTDTGEYLLGEYDLEQRLRFDSLRIRSVKSDQPRPLYPMVFEATATGRLRYRFQDGWFRTTVHAQVRNLTVLFVLVPVAHPDGIGFDYQAQINKLDIRVDRMPKWVERRLARALRRSLERSLNRRRKRERFARHRLPLWLPMAVSIDVEIVNPPFLGE